MRPLLLFLAALTLPAITARAENAYRLMAPSDLAALSGRFEPGDVVLLPDATWDNATLTFRGKGTIEKPITLRPAKGAHFTLGSGSTLVIDGEYLVVEGLTAKASSGGAATAVVTLKGRGNRLTAATLTTAAANAPLLRVEGAGHHIDHCTFTQPGGAAIVSAPTKKSAADVPTQIDHNRFIGGSAPAPAPELTLMENERAPATP